MNPPQSRYGTSRSDSGVPTNLAVGASFKLDPESAMTMGLLINGVVGGNVNFAGSFTTPTLGPRQPPNYFGLGPVFANTALLSIKPMASYRFSDRLSFAAAPVITTGTVQFNPAFFAPGPPDQFGVDTFPSATNSRPFWGGGFELGLFYELNDAWNVGFSYKSPVWQEKWSYNSYNPDLSPRTISTQADVPAIYSWGVAYKGIDRLLDRRRPAVFRLPELSPVGRLHREWRPRLEQHPRRRRRRPVRVQRLADPPRRLPLQRKPDQRGQHPFQHPGPRIPPAFPLARCNSASQREHSVHRRLGACLPERNRRPHRARSQAPPHAWTPKSIPFWRA